MTACLECQKPFEPLGKGDNAKKFCSSKCGRRYNGWVSAYPGLPKSSVGAIGELRASADLLAKGFEVFRSVSQHCSCDLAILKDNKLLRIEVRTGYKNPRTGTITFPNYKQSQTKADHFAVILPDEIVYIPELPKGETE